MPINGVSLVHGNVSLVNLSWNHLGNELVIFDSLGKISIFNITTSICEFSLPKKCVLDVEDQLNEVVGSVWLNADKPVISTKTSRMMQEHADRDSNHFIRLLRRKKDCGNSRLGITKPWDPIAPWVAAPLWLQ